MLPDCCNVPKSNFVEMTKSAYQREKELVRMNFHVYILLRPL